MAAAAGADVLHGRQGVRDHALADLLHRDAFELVRRGVRALQPRQRAPAQLLGALSCDVDEQKAAGDERGRRRCLCAGACPANQRFAAMVNITDYMKCRLSSSSEWQVTFRLKAEATSPINQEPMKGSLP